MESMKAWREKNPNYFKYDESKEPGWIETQRKRSKLWREKNPDKVRAYRQAHNEEYRNYMRDYMRKYRQIKTSSAQGNPAITEETKPNLQTGENINP